MGKNMIKRIISALLVVTMLSGCGNKGYEDYDYIDDGENATAKVYFAGDDVEFNIRPQDDFYGYVNAEQLWNMSVPHNANSSGTMDNLQLKLNEQINGIVQEVIQSGKDYEKGSDAQIIRACYDLYMNGKHTDKTVFDEVFNRIDSADSIREIFEVIGWLYTDYDVNTFFSLEVDMDPYDTSRNTLFVRDAETLSVRLKEMYESDDIATGFRDEMIERMLGYGVNKEDAVKLAECVVYLWLDIAYNTDFDSLENVEESLKDRKYNLDEFEGLFKNLDAKEFLRNFSLDDDDISEIDYLYVYAPEQIEAIDRLFTDENLDAIKNYCKEAFLFNYEDYLPPEYNYGLIEYKQPDEQEIVQKVSEAYVANIDHLYMDKYYTQEMNDYMQEMIEDITSAYIEMINGAD